MIDMEVFGNDEGWWCIKATVPGVYNPTGGLAVWSTSYNGVPQPFERLQGEMNKLASKVQASKPFPKEISRSGL